MRARTFFLLEAPIDFGGVPDFIPPEKKRKIERGEHPYANFGGLPKQAEPGAFPPAAAGEGRDPEPQAGGAIGNYAELLASDQYPKIVRKLARYAGIQPAQLPNLLRNPGGLHRMVGQAMQRAMQAQEAHREELEKAAVDIVLSLPEFQMAAEAVQAGELRIEAKLVRQVDPGEFRQEPEEPEQEEVEIAQIAMELDLEKQKRRVINMMIQGAAVNKGYAFHQIQDRLTEIDPNLINAFGLLMAFGDFNYWAMPEEVQKAAHGSGEGAAGKSRFRIGEDGVPVVEAEAIFFPILIHEIVKGLMEYISHDEDEDPETRAQVQGQVDVLDNEPWDMKLGAPVWRQVLRMIGNENQHLMPLVYRQLIRLPPEQFNARMKALLSGNAEARAWLRDIVQDIQADQQEESAGDSSVLVARLLG